MYHLAGSEAPVAGNSQDNSLSRVVLDQNPRSIPRLIRAPGSFRDSSPGDVRRAFCPIGFYPAACPQDDTLGIQSVNCIGNSWLALARC